MAKSRHLPANQEQFLEVGCDVRETGKIALFQANGYQPTRYFIEMVRNLDQAFPHAPMPYGLKVRPAKPEHYRIILEALNEAFREIARQQRMIFNGGLTVGAFSSTCGKWPGITMRSLEWS